MAAKPLIISHLQIETAELGPDNSLGRAKIEGKSSLRAQ
jgi:hypothetical protein